MMSPCETTVSASYPPSTNHRLLPLEQQVVSSEQQPSPPSTDRPTRATTASACS